MSLKAGTTLGAYSLAAKIGEGGMEEVYRARDTTLDRDVGAQDHAEGPYGSSAVALGRVEGGLG